MQCPTCNVVYSNGLDVCPRCKTAAPQVSMSEEITDTENIATNGTFLKDENEQVTDKQTETAAQPSRLLKFPGKKRQEMPAWRKELLEKFKEIQDKRTNEAVNDESEESSPQVFSAPVTGESSKAHLEVVPPAPVNPIVAKALERIERANSKPINTPTTNVAMPKEERVAMVAGSLPLEQKDREQRLSLIPPKQKAQAASASANSNSNMQSRSHTKNSTTHTQSSSPVLQAAKVQVAMPLNKEKTDTGKNGSSALTDVSSNPAKQSFNSQISKASIAAGVETIKTENTKEVLKEISLQASDILETLSEPTAETFTNNDSLTGQYNDYAPYMPRMISVLFDSLAIIFAASPFAAVLELGGVDWANERILLSLGGILLIVSFFYLMASVAMLGRTWGMATLSLRVADAETGDSPTLGQSCGRALLFMLSFIALGLPFLYSLFDIEGRALHDRIVGTIVLKED